MYLDSARATTTKLGDAIVPHKIVTSQRSLLLFLSSCCLHKANTTNSHHKLRKVNSRHIMIWPHSLQCVLFLGICIAVTISGVSAEYPYITYRYSSGKGGKGKGGRNEYVNSWNEDPDEDNVESPPIATFTEPSSAPSGTPTCPPKQSAQPSTQPSFSPSHHPTNQPSPIPSATPTVSQIPTVAPSTSPSVSPSASPSVSPTVSAAPSQSHAPTISSAPSQSQSPTTSVAPSVSSAPTITPVPSVSSSPSTSLAPTVAKCTTNEAGFYGDSSANDLVVSFGYELEYEAGYNASDVISGLENSFNDFLLPFLFPSDCPTDDERRILVSFHRRLETIGVSKRPDDVPIDGGKQNDVTALFECFLACINTLRFFFSQ